MDVGGRGAHLQPGRRVRLGGTIGQPEAGTTRGEGYALVGGFWAGLAEQPEPNSYLYLPLVLC